MKVLFRNDNHIKETKDCIDGLLEYLASIGGVGFFRGGSNLFNGCNLNLNLFEEELINGQYDYEPTLIVMDRGEYGNCMLSIYEGHDITAFFRYEYQYKGSLLCSWGEMDLYQFKNKIEREL